MRKKLGKYIVHISQDYFFKLCLQRRITTSEEKDKLFRSICDSISSFLKGEQGVALFSPTYVNSNGQRIRSFEISPLLSPDNPKTLHYIRKMNQRRKR